MLTKGNYFQGQERDEKVVLFIRGHWMGFVMWIMIIIIMFIMPVALVYFYSGNSPSMFTGINRSFLIVGISGYILITLAVFLTAWIAYYLNVTIITPEHLIDIKQKGLFNRKVSEQSLLRVQDVSARITGVFQTFFGYGTVLVETAGEAPNFDMYNIPHPNRVANTILMLHEKLIEESGSDKSDLADGIGLEKQNHKQPSKEKGGLSLDRNEPIIEQERKSDVNERFEKKEIKEEEIKSKLNQDDEILPIAKSVIESIKAQQYIEKTKKSNDKVEIVKTDQNQEGELKENEEIQL